MRTTIRFKTKEELMIAVEIGTKIGVYSQDGKTRVVAVNGTYAIDSPKCVVVMKNRVIVRVKN